MNARTSLHPLSLAVLMTVSAAASAAPGSQDESEAAQARDEIGAQLEELGTTLRAAVMSGTLTDEDAREVYGRVVRAAKAAYARDFGDGGGKTEASPSAKGNVIRLAAPRPEQIRVLLQAEFLRRHLPFLRDELDLDRDQMMIAGILFDDYAEAYELASAPLREALAQYRSATMNSYITFVLEDADVKLGAALENARQVDREEAVARMADTLERIDREKAEGLASASEADRERYEAWKRSMIAATSELDERLAAIRDRTTAQLAEMGRPDATITADDLVRMAIQLRSDRALLRAGLTESIEMIATEEQRGEESAHFEAAMARIRIGQLLPQGRLGGEAMNLWAALAEIARDQASHPGRNEPLEYAKTMLEERAPEIAARLDVRTEASIDRELAGLELRSVRDQIAAANGESIFDVDERRLAGVIRPYAGALRREVEASVAARDALLALLDESSAYIEATSPDTGSPASYRDAALRRGFPVETRRRWSERAVEAALQLDGLDADVMDALLALDSDLAIELQTLRENAIAKRIQRDPELARLLITAQFEGGRKDDIDEDVWREVDYAAFAATDERMEIQLRGILAPEQFESLPARRRMGKWGGADGKGEGKGKTAGKSLGK
jgi:hypothetical protein